MTMVGCHRAFSTCHYYTVLYTLLPQQGEDSASAAVMGVDGTEVPTTARRIPSSSSRVSLHVRLCEHSIPPSPSSSVPLPFLRLLGRWDLTRFPSRPLPRAVSVKPREPHCEQQPDKPAWRRQEVAFQGPQATRRTWRLG